MIQIRRFDVPGVCEGKIRQILTTKMMYGEPKVWVMMDDSLERDNKVEFFRVGDGWQLEGNDAEVMKNAFYVGSVRDEERINWHIFGIAVTDEKKEETKEEAVADSDSNVSES